MKIALATPNDDNEKYVVKIDGIVVKKFSYKYEANPTAYAASNTQPVVLKETFDGSTFDPVNDVWLKPY